MKDCKHNWINIMNRNDRNAKWCTKCGASKVTKYKDQKVVDVDLRYPSNSGLSRKETNQGGE